MGKDKKGVEKPLFPLIKDKKLFLNLKGSKRVMLNKINLDCPDFTAAREEFKKAEEKYNAIKAEVAKAIFDYIMNHKEPVTQKEIATAVGIKLQNVTQLLCYNVEGFSEMVNIIDVPVTDTWAKLDENNNIIPDSIKKKTKMVRAYKRK